MNESHGPDPNEQAASSDTIFSEEELTPAGLPRVSALLVEARLAQGFTQEEIAARLYLNPNFIRYMDEGQFQRFPKVAFIKGYLRSYARELGLSGDQIVKLFDEGVKLPATEQQGPLWGVTEQKVGSAHITGPVALTGVASLLLIIALLVTVWWLSPGEESGSQPVVAPELAAPEEDADASAVDLGEIGEALGNLARKEPEGAPDAGAAAPGSQAAEATAGEAPVEGTAQAAAGAPEGTEAQAVPAAPMAAPGAPGVPVVTEVNGIRTERTPQAQGSRVQVTAKGTDHLQLTFTADCWLEAFDVGGALVYSDLNHPGDLLDIQGTGPFRVLIGRVSAVTVKYNDKPVDLSAHTFNDTARLVIE